MPNTRAGAAVARAIELSGDQIFCLPIRSARLWQHFTAIRKSRTIENRIFGSTIERTQTILRTKLRAKHIVFVYSLCRAVSRKKLALIEKARGEAELDLRLRRSSWIFSKRKEPCC